MQNDSIPELLLREFLSSPSGEKIRQIMETIATVQRRLIELAESKNQRQLDLLKIGTVFQIFLVDVLASGKKPANLTDDDWKGIAEKVFQYAVLSDGQEYSVFVFTLYADYIDLSADVYEKKLEEKRLQAIRNIASELRQNETKLYNGEISEVDYTEDCLWLSLEGMVKLLSSWLAWRFIPENYNEFAQLAEAVADFGFECARYVHYAKEKQLLDSFIQHQYILDEQLQCQYEAYLAELNEDAARFQGLIDDAFSPNIRDSLMNSATLARAAGVKEEEILTSIEEVDAFFLD